MTPKVEKLLRTIPSVSKILECDEVVSWQRGLPRTSVVAAIRAALRTARGAILSEDRREPVDLKDILARTEEELSAQAQPSLRRVINATGIVLHTGLGRAPLCLAAVDAIVEGASGYCNLEYDLGSGERRRRNSHVFDLLTSLTGAEAATIVNNNAAATLLIARTFAASADIIISRGELVEIGGGFRLPEIIAASGATLREVGTTNRTRLADYERAISQRTSMLMRVHTSNYRIVGYVESVAIGPMAALAHRCGLICVDDLGSGALFGFESFGLPDEPCVRDSIAAGADLACFSGDKLLGGPQCGIVVGRRDLIEDLESSPLMRTYRVGKLTLLALEATLRCYKDADPPAPLGKGDRIESVVTLRTLGLSRDVLADRAGTLSEQLKQALPNEKFYVGSDVGYVGGGSMPGRGLDTVVVQWHPTRVSVETAVGALRCADIPVVARIRDDAVCFDLRTVSEPEFESLVQSVGFAAQGDDE